jgi:hypothetical protein
MSKEADAAEKAEFIQSVKALMIPLSLFLACVIMAAGTFLIYNNESIGWAFVVVSATTVIAAFVALIRFQNKYRARGIILSEMKTETSDPVQFQPALGLPIEPPQIPAKDASPKQAEEFAAPPEPLVSR